MNMLGMFSGKDTPKVVINRSVYTTEEFNDLTKYEDLKFKCKKPNVLRQKPTCKQIYSYTKSLVPILSWLPYYDYRKYLLPDILSGLTAAILHIPQGLAYGILADMTPVCGIYTSFFPALVYIIFGTSRHNSMGTFAIISIMTNSAIDSVLPDKFKHPGQPNNATEAHILEEQTKIQIVTALTFTIAIIQFCMFFLRLGLITTLLSSALISGFTTGAAFHTAAAQFNDLFGLKIKRHGGIFNIGFLLSEIYRDIALTNWAAILISLISMLVLVIHNEILKPWLRKRTIFPIPIELIVLIVGNIISYFIDLENKYGVHIVGHIPVGFPSPEVPPIHMFTKLLPHALAITAVSYAITMSLGLTFSKKCFTELDANQELFAMGASNVMGSFFKCIPVCSSLARTTVSVQIGNMSQISTIVSCAVLLLLILWIGPAFEYLPRCILASVILISLKGLFVQFRDIPKFLRLSKFDGFIWLITCSTVVLLDVDYGLFIGLACSICVIVFLNCKSHASLLGVLPGTEFYLDKRRFTAVEEIDEIKIIQYIGELNFGTIPWFKSSINNNLGFDVRQYVIESKQTSKTNQKNEGESITRNIPFRCVILDLSTVKNIDPTGVECLKSINDDLKHLDIEIFLVGITGRNYEAVQRFKKYANKETDFKLFPSTHDAVLYAKANII